jgi:hypothetical protein
MLKDHGGYGQFFRCLPKEHYFMGQVQYSASKAKHHGGGLGGPWDKQSAGGTGKIASSAATAAKTFNDRYRSRGHKPLPARYK